MMILWILAVTVLLGVASARKHAARNHHRWPRLASAAVVEGGRFASLRADGMPLSAQLTAAGAVAFGLLTMTVFVPAGSLLALFAIDGDLATIVFGAGIGAVCVSGAALGFRYARAGRDLAERDGDAISRLVRHSVWHHLSVAALFSALAVTMPTPWLALTALPCAVGILLAAALLRAVPSVHANAYSAWNDPTGTRGRSPFVRGS